MKFIYLLVIRQACDEILRKQCMRGTRLNAKREENNIEIILRISKRA